jgi:CspA family cold shock protein
MSEVKKGTVKFFNGSYGFIEQSDGQKDIYFHKSGINIGVKSVSEKQEVEYEIGETNRGPVANNVTPQ